MTQDHHWKNPNPEHRSVLEPPADEPSKIQASSYLHWIKGIFREQPVREAHRRFPTSRVGRYFKERDKSKGRQECYAPCADNLVSDKNGR
jgi:hypothetical protein